MPLTDTRKAIGAVAQLLSYQVSLHAGAYVSVGPIEETTGTSGARINLFLFEVALDPSMRSIALDRGQEPPLWMVLRFVMTAFDSAGKSDTVAALKVLGAGLAAIQRLAHLPLEGIAPEDLAALDPNPEPLKVTLLETDSELLSRLFQGEGDRYRLSQAFEVRPVMIAAAPSAAYGLLVGVDYEAGVTIGEAGVAIAAGPALRPSIAQVVPSAAAVGQSAAIYGDGLSTDLFARLGDVDLPLTIGAEGEIRLLLDATALTGDHVSAGPQALAVVRVLPSGRRRSSRPFVFELLPTVDTVAIGGVTPVVASDPNSPVTATITIDGALLGGPEDELYVALVQGGVTVATFDELTDGTGPSQTRKVLVIPEARAIPEGAYRLVLRVNGSQARQSPELSVEAP